MPRGFVSSSGIGVPRVGVPYDPHQEVAASCSYGGSVRSTCAATLEWASW